jgi:hypothetical protein
MKKSLLHYLCFILCIIVSCSKSPGNVTETSTPPSKVFIPVVLIDFRVPGGAVCSHGIIMLRQDTAITYHSLKLPANVNITYSPVLVNIQFHDTIPLFGCFPHEIVIDSLKF